MHTYTHPHKHTQGGETNVQFVPVINITSFRLISLCLITKPITLTKLRANKKNKNFPTFFLFSPLFFVTRDKMQTGNGRSADCAVSQLGPSNFTYL